MMNINLNLLPVIKKNRLDYIINFLLIRDILELIIIVGSILATTLIWSWFFMEKDFANLVANATAVNHEYYAYNQDVKNVNNMIRDINLANQNFLPLAPKLKELINSLPNDIKINFLQIDRQTQTLAITGTALTRSALLHYQGILNEIPWITTVETPASQLFQKDNINFEFKTKLKNLSLKGQDRAPSKKPAINEDL